MIRLQVEIQAYAAAARELQSNHLMVVAPDCIDPPSGLTTREWPPRQPDRPPSVPSELASDRLRGWDAWIMEQAVKRIAGGGATSAAVQKENRAVDWAP